MSLREHNIKLLSELKDKIIEHNLSSPLLVSSNKSYLDGLKQNKSIFYIGQETNGWCHSLDVNDLEETYYNFLMNNNYNKEFWRFLKNIRGNDSNSFSNVLWSNALICGKKDEIGAPTISDQIMDVSLDNLKYLYNLIKPDMTIIVSGPTNPYYEIITEFLKHINSSLSGLYPKSNEILLTDSENNVHYTYHPNYLNRKGKFLEISKELNKYTK